jgi:hypothetical protein
LSARTGRRVNIHQQECRQRIYEKEKIRANLENVKFLADGSTDLAVIEEEFVYSRCVNGKVTASFLSKRAVPRADADTGDCEKSLWHTVTKMESRS